VGEQITELAPEPQQSVVTGDGSDRGESMAIVLSASQVSIPKSLDALEFVIDELYKQVPYSTPCASHSAGKSREVC
jgi:hypothetical protein